MKPSQAIRFGIAAIVLVLLLAACMHPSVSSSSASGSSSGSSTSASTTSPAIEQTTGLESPGSPTGNPSLSLPSPPVGNNHNDGDQCITITWLTRPIPHGDIVEITSVTVTATNTGLIVFDPGATHCTGGQSCVGYQFSGFNDNAGFCSVGVTYEGQGKVDPGGGDDSESGTIVLAGRLSCPHISSPKCHDDGVVMEAAARPISFSVDIDSATTSPPIPPPADSTPPSPPVSPPTSPQTSDSSTPVTPGSP
jgi:hypothetical protein